MCAHEQKICLRCSNKFECKLGSITECQCYGISLTAEETAFIESRYDDCLCGNCLIELKNRYIAFRKKLFLK
jgi:cysteine-rich CWC protein